MARGNRSESSKQIDNMNVDDVADLVAKARKCSREEAVDYSLRLTAKRLLALENAPKKISEAQIASAEAAAEKALARAKALREAKAALVAAKSPVPSEDATAPAPEPTKGKRAR